MSDAGSLLNQLRIDRRPVNTRRRWPWIVAALALFAVIAAVFAARRPSEVETALARAADADGPVSLLDASGFVTARRIATVSAKVTGKVDEVLIEEGQQVAAGAVLARLDATDARAQRELVAAQLAASQSQLAEARAQLRLAEQTLLRTRELAARKLVAQSALDVARADRDALAARLASLGKVVAVTREQLAVAELGIENTVVRAPFAGVIVAKSAQPGEMISPISAGGGFTRTGIGTLVDMDSLEVQVDVNEAYIGRVKPSMKVNSVLNAYPDWSIPSSVIAIVPTADRAKATVKVRIALGAKDPRIVPDMGVRVSFLQEPSGTDAGPAGVWLPVRAVVQRDGAARVFVLHEGRAVMREVGTGPIRDADQLVNSGVAAGETVILSPAESLRDGQAVVAKAP